MKTSFKDIRECIHVFAQFSQDQGKSGNVFFYGNTLYSYGYHFPLANRITNAKGEKAVLLNGRSYSNSTSKHQNWTAQATSHYNQIISFGMDRNSTTNHEANEQHYIREFDTIANNLSVARRPAGWIEKANTLNDQAFEYFTFFGLIPSQEYQTAYHNATNPSEEIKTMVKAQQAETLRRKKERESEEKKSLELKISEWIAGERDYLPRMEISILRKIGDQVETSQGIKMTIQQARAIYLQLKRQELKAGSSVLDHYTVISVNGVVKIGCHTFDTEYLLTFGKSL